MSFSSKNNSNQNLFKISLKYITKFYSSSYIQMCCVLSRSVVSNSLRPCGL